MVPGEVTEQMSVRVRQLAKDAALEQLGQHLAWFLSTSEDELAPRRSA